MIAATLFIARWEASSGAAGYRVDVAEDADFTVFVPGFEDLDVGNVTEALISGLTGETTYYVRVRAYNEIGISANSETKKVTTTAALTDIDGNTYSYVRIGSQEWIVENFKATKYKDDSPILNKTDASYTDWYLPSIDELEKIYTELHLHGVGGFSNDSHWSSSESAYNTAWIFTFTFGASYLSAKSNSFHFDICRSFVSADVYALREATAHGGWIFYIVDNGDGTFTYYEAAPYDNNVTAYAWSNVTNVLLGTTGTAIGTGSSNTAKIIAQAGGADDWFLPSKDELNAMYVNLHLFGLGNFSSDSYWSSTEYNAYLAEAQNFNTGLQSQNTKSSGSRIRACRSFVAGVGAYSLRDIGPTKGLIFYIDGAGTTYYECPTVDQNGSLPAPWSNVVDILIGTTSSAIGEGQLNNIKIFSQSGHVNSSALICSQYNNIYAHTGSAASLCNDLVFGGWPSDSEGAYCWYDNNIANKTPYGALYNWYAVNNSKGLAYFEKGGVEDPGWRVPTKADWLTLRAFLGGVLVAGGKLKETGVVHWTAPNVGATNEYGFTAVGSGLRETDASFVYKGLQMIAWTATPDEAMPEYQSYYCTIFNNNATIDIGATTLDHHYGFAVRCVRDV